MIENQKHLEQNSINNINNVLCIVLLKKKRRKLPLYLPYGLESYKTNNER